MLHTTPPPTTPPLFFRPVYVSSLHYSCCTHQLLQLVFAIRAVMHQLSLQRVQLSASPDVYCTAELRVLHHPTVALHTQSSITAAEQQSKGWGLGLREGGKDVQQKCGGVWCAHRCRALLQGWWVVLQSVCVCHLYCPYTKCNARHFKRTPMRPFFRGPSPSS